MNKLLLATAIAVASITATAPASAATLTQSVTDPFSGGRGGGVRYRAFSNNSGQARAFGGYHDIGQASNQKASIASPAFTYGASQSFSLSYDGASELSFSLGNQTRSFSDFEANLPAVVSASPLNRLSFIVRDGSAGTITLSNLVVNGVSYDDVSSVDGINYYTLAGNFRNAFSVTGTLGLSGVTGGAESNSLQILVGNAVPEPATWAMMIGGFGLVGASMRRRAARAVLA